MWGQPMSAYDAFNAHASFPLPMRSAPKAQPVSHTQQPVVTGTSVLGLKFKGGVMLAADNLASYGSLARFRDIQRLHPLGSHCVMAVAGDMADFQWLKRDLGSILREEEALSLTDNHPSLSAANIYNYLSIIFYNRRSKGDPVWNTVLVGGWDEAKKESFLGYVDLLGTTYSSPTLATGYGAHIAQPLLREAFEAKAGLDGKGELPTAEEAEKLLDDCMKVLFYRDARSLNKYQIATITAEGVKISDSKSAKTEWGFAEGLRGYGAQDR
ncbi:20S proteasome subunit beta 7 [Tremella mesenterica]|uniref:Proteasome subunit beta n=1 Tax=Tremella mesenterica TaxID=5217 RepID=A0A4Q1BCL4_TREME|nr:20S proteasome subunit beta 7 [Tremella mesenterica]